MRLLTTDSAIYICSDHHPSKTADAPTSSIKIDGNGIKVCLHEATTDHQSTYIYAIFGIIRLLKHKYVIVVNNSTSVGQLNGADVRAVDTFQVIRVPSTSSTTNTNTNNISDDDERECVRLVKKALIESGRYYFSYNNYDITHSMQRQCELNTKCHVWERADERFMWNRHLIDEFVLAGADQWVTPMMNGYIYIEPAATYTTNNPLVYALISRRSKDRTGKRYMVRGLDIHGNAANFVETEQLIIVGTEVMSFVQTRGSIPVLWRQKITLRYSPKIELMLSGTEAPQQAFRRHFRSQVHHYGRQVCVSLINLKGSELALSRAYESCVQRAGNVNIRLVSFDFHKECRGMKYENIHKLVSSVGDEYANMGYFHATCGGGGGGGGGTGDSVFKRVYRTQTGVYRTNCMDNLDRTNVVQSVFARYALNAQLAMLMDKSQPHDLTFAECAERSARDFENSSFERMFKHAWANNADAMSLPYSGTGAQKTDYTRTGKRTKVGALRDLSYSIIRYYKNNFQDGEVQDSLDLLFGVYKLDGVSTPIPFAHHTKKTSMNNKKMWAVVMLIVVVCWMEWMDLITIITGGIFVVILTLLGSRKRRERLLCAPRLGRYDEYEEMSLHPPVPTPQSR